MNREFLIAREELERVFGNPRVVRQFEEMQQAVAETEETVGANIEATESIKDASFVTLSANAELSNEYVLQVGEGLALTTEPGVLRLTLRAPVVVGGFSVRMTAVGDTELVLPLSGVLVARNAPETLKNKTLSAPRLSDIVNAVDDAAAAGAGVPVGGVYRNASALAVRVA